MENKIILFEEKSECCGCGTCSAICPKNAIKMVEDEYGFLYPSIDSNKCISCHTCQKKCPLKSKSEEKSKIKKVFVGATTDDKMIRKSASGGIFTTIAKKFILNEGIVVGCTMFKDKDRFKVKHIIIDNLEDLNLIQGSKYIQSNIMDIFRCVKENLKLNKKILFSGTACQIAALYSYLGTTNNENLYCIDIICHGVPSEKMFNEYIKYTENRKKISISEYNFRDKSITWKHCGKIKYKNKLGKTLNELFIPQMSSFYKLFLDRYIFRDSCYKCHFANSNRVSDITLWDFWGIEEEFPEVLLENGGKLDKKKGISFICVNSQKGKYMLNLIMSDISIYNSDYYRASKHNTQLLKPMDMPKLREKVLLKYKKYGYSGINKFYKKYIGFKLPIYLMKNKKINKLK